MGNNDTYIIYVLNLIKRRVGTKPLSLSLSVSPLLIVSRTVNHRIYGTSPSWYVGRPRLASLGIYPYTYVAQEKQGPITAPFNRWQCFRNPREWASPKSQHAMSSVFSHSCSPSIFTSSRDARVASRPSDGKKDGETFASRAINHIALPMRVCVVACGWSSIHVTISLTVGNRCGWVKQSAASSLMTFKNLMLIEFESIELPKSEEKVNGWLAWHVHDCGIRVLICCLGIELSRAYYT